MNVFGPKLLVVLPLLGFVFPNIAEAIQFERGDVFASLTNGNIGHYTPTGVLKAVYNVAGGETPPPGGEIPAGMAFDAAGNLYVTRYSAFKLAKFDNSGNLLNSNLASGLYAPQSVAIDQSGNIYVGNLYVGLRKYDALGGFLGTITPDRIEFFDLSLDEGTIFYGDGSDMRRVSNTIPGTPGADFASGLTRAFAMRLMANGEWLIANRNDIKRLSPSGAIITAYDFPNEDQWFALNLDPDGVTFWAASYAGSTIYRFDIATGQIVTMFGTGDIKVGGLAIYSAGPAGGPVTPAPPPSISKGGIVLANLLPKVSRVSPLSIISIFGQAFSVETVLSPTLDEDGDLDTTLAGACVEIGGKRAPIFAITPTQANVQTPTTPTRGPVDVVVIRNCGTPEEVRSNVALATVEEATPGFFLFPPLADDGLIAARFNSDNVAVAPNGVFVDQSGTSRPAVGGDIIVLYGTGWGETTAALSTGELALSAAELLPGANPMVSFGGTVLAQEDVFYVGVTPNTAGLYQLAIRVPASAQPGSNQVVLTVYGKSTPVGPVIPVAPP